MDYKIQGARDSEPAETEEERCDLCHIGKLIATTKCCNNKICETCLRIYSEDYIQCTECLETEDGQIETQEAWFIVTTVVFCRDHGEGKVEECDRCGSGYCSEHKLVDEEDSICKPCKDGTIVVFDPPFLDLEDVVEENEQGEEPKYSLRLI